MDWGGVKSVKYPKSSKMLVVDAFELFDVSLQMNHRFVMRKRRKVMEDKAIDCRSAMTGLQDVFSLNMI